MIENLTSNLRGLQEQAQDYGRYTIIEFAIDSSTGHGVVSKSIALRCHTLFHVSLSSEAFIALFKCRVFSVQKPCLLTCHILSFSCLESVHHHLVQIRKEEA